MIPYRHVACYIHHTSDQLFNRATALEYAERAICPIVRTTDIGSAGDEDLGSREFLFHNVVEEKQQASFGEFIIDEKHGMGIGFHVRLEYLELSGVGCTTTGLGELTIDTQAQLFIFG
jgi:hypothetical protein